MGQALYRVYRSKNLGQIVGQEHITATLSRAIKQQQLSHAYLFTGPRGVGKTSIARILAHEINQLAYDEPCQHLDIIEIDAASNRRIDEMRELRDKVYIAPAAARHKIYIIDEVHMLTKEAFNALLKTLEEPPAHVVFILATTEAYKLPATIVSRTQRFIFRPVEPAKVAAHLRTIAQQENITVTDEALDLMAAFGQGSLRDSISLLDQARNAAAKVGLKTVQQMLGVASDVAINTILEQMAAGQKAALVGSLQAQYDSGQTAGQLARQIAAVLRRQLIDGHNRLPDKVCLELLSNLISVPAANDPERALEISLLRAVISSAVITEPQPAPVKPPTAKADKPRSTVLKSAGKLDLAAWPEVLATIKQRYNTLYSIVNKAEANLVDGQLELCVQFPFHQKRLNESKNKQIISTVIKEITGLDVGFSCRLVPKPETSTPPHQPEPSTAGPLQDVSNIFGGGEMLS